LILPIYLFSMPISLHSVPKISPARTFFFFPPSIQSVATEP